MAIALIASIYLFGCGGGNSTQEVPSAVWGDISAAKTETPPQFAQKKIFGVVTGPANAGSDLTYANMLFDWAEGVFPQYFPSHSSTLVEGGWFYRAYFSTGIFLGVNSGDVYVMGGVFGPIPLRVGRISDYISAPNTAPVANSGSSQSVATGSVVTLNGSASSDANGDQLYYSWTIINRPYGSSATLAGSTLPRPSFIADVSGSYLIQLVVNDGKVSSAASTVTVTASAVSMTCGGGSGGGYNGISLYTPSNQFSYSLSTTSASAYDLVTLTWGARYTGGVGSYTGSLKANLWAVKAPYFGGTINGTILGEFSPNFYGSGAYSSTQIAGGGYSTNTIVSSTGNYNPSAGQYCLVITLSQYMPGQCNPNPNGYCMVDWLQFDNPVTFR